jgi:flagellar motility protein MotE (MotC chaperone)
MKKRVETEPVDEDIDDLPDEPVEAKPAKAAKAAKPAKPPKPPKAVKPRSPRDTKAKPQGGGYASGLMTGLLVMILLASAAAGGMYFNLGGLAEKTISMLELDPVEAGIREKRAYELDRLEAKLQDERTTLEQGQRKLEKDRTDLAKLALAAKTLEAELKAQSALLTPGKAELAAVVAIYEALEPSQAALVLAASKDKDMLVIILKNMTQTRVSQILGKMEATKAAELLALMAGGSAGGQNT